MVGDMSLLKTNYPIRTKPFWNFVRATPATYILVVILLFLTKPSKVTLYLLVSYMVLTLSVPILKETIFRPIYYLFGKSNDKLPLFGLGRRPNGATDCGAFLNFNSKLATSFGMPSGHSQLTWMVAAYIICHLYVERDTLLENTKKWKSRSRTMSIVFSIVVVLFAIAVSYSRVYVEYCHTMQQVVIGGLLGVVMGIGVYVVQKKYIE